MRAMKNGTRGKRVFPVICAAAIVIAVGFDMQIAIFGMWVTGVPAEGAVTSVSVSCPALSETEKELTAAEDIEQCVDMAGLLRFDPLGRADPAAEPAVTLCYHLKDGGSVTLSADGTTLFRDGKRYALKDKDTFVETVQALFFYEEPVSQVS